MPVKKIVLLFLILDTYYLIHNTPLVSAQSATPPKSIKLANFTPPPTKTPAPTSPPAVPTFPDQPPPPPEDGSPKANEVIDLVNQIRSYCPGGIVTASNLSCVDRLVLPNSTDLLVKSELKFSTTWNIYLQCVGFVRSATARIYGSPVNNGGHAIDFATNLPTGYIFIDKKSSVRIKTHDLAIWNYDTYGHIAYVVQVYSANIFQVAEANLGGSGLVRLNNTTVDNPNLIGWLRRL